MANSYSAYTGDGVTKRFGINFARPIYVSVRVLISGIEVTSGWAIDDVTNEVVFDTAPVLGAAVLIERYTSTDLLHKFGQGAAFTGTNVDENFDQILSKSEETQEITDLQVSRTLRVPANEQSINPLPPRDVRAGEYLGFDGAGNPITIPAPPDAAGVLLTLADADGQTYIGQVDSFADLRNIVPRGEGVRIHLRGYWPGSTKGGGDFIGHLYSATDDSATVAATPGGYHWKRVYDTLSAEMCGAVGDGVTSDTAAIQRGINIVASQFAKVLDVPGYYAIPMIAGTTQALTVPDGITFNGKRRGMQQGPGTLSIPALPARAYSTDTGAFVMTGATGVIGFKCGGNVSFFGCEFLYPEQAWNATTAADFKQYGYTIDSGRSLQLLNVRYAFPWDFVNAASESHCFDNVYGWAIHQDFRIYKSADVNRLTNIHSNPNVYRPTTNTIALAAQLSDSCSFRFEEHDGVVMVNIHSFGKQFNIYNHSNGTARLMNVQCANFLFDQSGCMLYHNGDSSTIPSFTNGAFIGRWCLGQGYVQLEKATVTQVQTIRFSNVSIGHGFTTGNPPYIFYFANTAGYIIDAHGHTPNLLGSGLNSPLSSNIMRGDWVVGTRLYPVRQIERNLLHNDRFARTDQDAVPYGWEPSSSVTVVNNVVTGSNAASTVGVGIRQRVSIAGINTRTFYAVATAKGDSAGVTLISFTQDFSQQTVNTQAWVQWGSIFVAKVTATDTGKYHHDCYINAPSATGGSMTVSSAVFVGGDPQDVMAAVPGAGAMPEELPGRRIVATIAPNGTFAIPATFMGDRGVYRLMIDLDHGSTQSIFIATISKRLVGSTATITMDLTDKSGSETFGITWGSISGDRPVLSSVLGGTLNISIIGR